MAPRRRRTTSSASTATTQQGWSSGGVSRIERRENLVRPEAQISVFSTPRICACGTPGPSKRERKKNKPRDTIQILDVISLLSSALLFLQEKKGRNRNTDSSAKHATLVYRRATNRIDRCRVRIIDFERSRRRRSYKRHHATFLFSRSRSLHGSCNRLICLSFLPYFIHPLPDLWLASVVNTRQCP